MDQQAQQEQEAPARRSSMRGSFQETIIRLVIVYLVTSAVFQRGLPVVPPTGATVGPVSGSSAPVPSTLSGVYTNSFGLGDALQLTVYVTEHEKHSVHDTATTGGPVFTSKYFHYTTDFEPVTSRVVIRPSQQVLAQNASLYVHAYLTNVPRQRVARLSYRVNRFYPPPPPEGYKTLLESSAEERAEVQKMRKEHEAKPWISYWRENVTLAVVVDVTAFDMARTPATIANVLTRDDSDKTYLPVFYVNDFWTYRDHFYPINASIHQTLHLDIELDPQSMWKWQLLSQMDQSFAQQQQWGMSMSGEMDDMKKILTETNPWFLGLTVIVSAVHMVFDFLAFKNDISFWRTRKSLEGLSVRSILIGFVCQLIIFLYLFDNETSWMILISAGISVVIEGWKITKANDVSFSAKFPFLHLKDKSSYASRTREFDEIAMRYLSYAVYPMVAIYAVYSLLYNSHKSYYSWLISSLSGAVYLFGFLQMTPQLFVNYKLKSVAHLPWKTLTYKFLNTFIDDMFAFIIKMPTMHRLSVFRDDIIFFIFLYQRWIYRVDMTRTNEFGQVFVPPEQQNQDEQNKESEEGEKKKKDVPYHEKVD